MHSRLLRYFLKVMDRKAISQAADELCITQPALTKSIRQLEDSLGVALFERLSTGVVPTLFAEILARRARLMDLEYRHALAEIRSFLDGDGGAISVGAAPVWQMRLLPPIVADFSRLQPKVKVKLTGGVIDTLVPALLAGKLDVICASLDFPSHPEIVKDHLTEIRHVVVARAAHPLARCKDIAPESLLDYPWLGLANDYVGTSRVNSFFAANELGPPRLAVETMSLSGMFSLLQSSDFIVSLAALLLPYAEALGIVRLPIRGTLWDTSAGIAYRSTKAPVPAINSFCTLIRSHFTT